MVGQWENNGESKRGQPCDENNNDNVKNFGKQKNETKKQNERTHLPSPHKQHTKANKKYST